MSIVELLQEVDKLAKVIIQKNLELEELKKGYNHRLHVINEFIAKVQPDQIDDDKITSESFTQHWNNKVTCPNCNHIVYNNSEQEFVLIPKKQLEYLSSQPEFPKHQEPTPHRLSVNNQKTKKKSHITCSFCKEQGHTRANCKKRLGLVE